MINGSEGISLIKPQMRFACGLIIALCCTLFVSCENDLRDVEKVSAKGQSIQMDKSTGVEIVYSDSAVVKAKILTPLLNSFKTAHPYREMPKGTTIIFFDDHQKESSRIVSDYAIQYVETNIVELRKNVVGTSIKGDVFKSDELIYDPKKDKPIFSTKLVTVTQTNGNIIFGNGFESDRNFDHWELKDGTGNFPSGTGLIE